MERLEALLRSERVPPGVAEQLRQRAEVQRRIQQELDLEEATLLCE
jgi:hypothetical protein